MGEAEVKELIGRCGGGTARGVNLEAFIDEINQELAHLDLEIKRVFNGRDGTPLWGLVGGRRGRRRFADTRLGQCERGRGDQVGDRVQSSGDFIL